MSITAGMQGTLGGMALVYMYTATDQGFGVYVVGVLDGGVYCFRDTITSIMRDTFKTDRLISKNAVPLSLSCSKSALHRFV